MSCVIVSKVVSMIKHQILNKALPISIQENRFLRLVVLGVWGFFSLLITACAEKESVSVTDKKEIVFNRDIRPILNKNCTGCHGGVGKQSGVSFITREEALGRGHSGRLTVVPGNPDASGLIERIESKDPNIRMPYKAPPLKANEIALLRQWIEEGADWQPHWAFVPPKRHTPPIEITQKYIENPIDQFVQAKLREKGLAPAKKAEKAKLLRRVSLDLIGLPPTLDELNNFISDQSDDAYEKQVDRLLASKHFGERWASMWLDLARYADTKGYTWDKYRAIWPYRDWVIDSFNQNKTYDDFVIEQLAGDLLPNRTIENIIATAFHRNTTSNDEGGTDDEEFRVVSVMDRVATTWSVLNGMTMNCVQCHAHPYDPIDHDEYYTSYSFLNTTLDADKFDDIPHLKYATSENRRQHAFRLQEELIEIKHTLARAAVDVHENDEWKILAFESGKIDERRAINIKRDLLLEKQNKIEDKSSYTYKNNLKTLERYEADIQRLSKEEPLKLSIQEGEVYETRENLAASAVYKLKTVPIQAAPSSKAAITALRFLVKGLDPDQSVHTPEAGYNINEVEIWHVQADGSEKLLDFASMVVGNTEVLAGQIPKLNAVFEQRMEENGSAIKPLLERDGMGGAIGLSGFHLFNARWSVAVLSEPLVLKEGEYLRIDTHRIWAKVRRLQMATSTSEEWMKLVLHPDRIQSIARYVELKKQLDEIETIDVPVMYEQDAWDQRGTALFGRGNFLAKEGPLLAPDTPGVFPVFDQEEKNRLTMAQWFFKPEQPLTSRVAVNRFWHALFGRGIVETLEDFGSIGEPPSHPMLLDWLALEFQEELRWDIKALLKLMVSSHTYQQDSKITSHLKTKNPDNQWLSRGPQQRLTAEMVRDQALFSSGLLNTEMGGKGVMPEQPENIWGRKGVVIKDWENAENEDRYRRSIYTFIKRQYYYPSFETFDMESRELSHARRIPTNTPLQALVTLNDPVYHQAAQSLARVMIDTLREGKSVSTLEDAVSIGFMRVASRKPSSTELETLINVLELAKDELGEKNTLGAWTAVASVILNLDIALTR